LLPNLLTGARIFLALCLYGLLWSDRRFFILIFWVAAATDTFDGYLARRLSAESDLGRRLDRAADLLYLGSTVVWSAVLSPRMFSDHTGVWLWVATAIIARQAMATESSENGSATTWTRRSLLASFIA
jgi:phosphatidylglycerophosphate synthase